MRTLLEASEQAPLDLRQQRRAVRAVRLPPGICVFDDGLAPREVRVVTAIVGAVARATRAFRNGRGGYDNVEGSLVSGKGVCVEDVLDDCSAKTGSTRQGSAGFRIQTKQLIWYKSPFRGAKAQRTTSRKLTMSQSENRQESKPPKHLWLQNPWLTLET